MEKKTASAITLTLLLIGMLALAFNIQPVKAEGTIYIRADGSVDPSGAPIQREGDIYTLTGNIASDADGIVIERNNMTLDGVGYTVQGTGSGNGIGLSGRSNVTIKNMEIKLFLDGIQLSSSSNNIIVGNNINNNDYGINLRSSSDYNNVSGNNITENSVWGILLDYSSNNSIAGNNINNNNDGIYIWFSSNNVICHNNFVANTRQVHIGTSGYANFWDDGYPSGGNYWSDYTGIDGNGDGIGDTPYIIDESNQDNYPLIHPYGSVQNLNTSMTYLTIQSAIDASETLNGHTIFVRTGTYYENVVISKSVALIGENRTTTVIDGSGTGIVVHIIADNVSVCGFTLQRGELSGTTSRLGVLRLDTDNNTIFGNLLKDTMSTVLGLWDSDHNLISQNIMTNPREISSWTIQINNSHDNIIEGNTIDNGGTLETSQNMGIFVGNRSSMNTIRGNNLLNLYPCAILVKGVSDNLMENNIVINSKIGIEIEKGSNNTIEDNEVINCTTAGLSLSFSDYGNNNLVGNTILNNTHGIEVLNCSANAIHHNNFLNNTQQVYDYAEDYPQIPPSINVWDNGYPSGGNYWSDYTGIDQKSGSYQNETGSDGMGDTPYVIDAQNQDNYPLMNPWPSGWKLDFAGPTNHPIVDFAVYSGSLYAAADNRLYVKGGSDWNVVDVPTFVTSLEPYGDKLVVGGQGGLYCYDGTSFSQIFSVPTYIKVLGSFNNTLYAGTMLDNPPKLYYCDGSADNPSDWHIDTDFSDVLNFSGPFGSIDSFAAYGASADADWPSFLHDAQHTGFSSSTVAGTNQTSWAFAFGANQIASPTAESGKIFICTVSGTVYALNAYTGSLVWSSQIGSGPTFVSPCVAEGIVFVGCYDGNYQTVFRALDQNTGEEIWNFTIQFFPLGFPQHIALTYSDGKVFAGQVGDAKIYALNATSGELIWSYDIGVGPGSKPQSNPAVSDGMLVVGSQDCRIYALNATTGFHIWNFTSEGPVRSSPAISGGAVFVTSSDGNLYALNQTTGGLLWDVTCISLMSSPALSDGLVFVGFEAFNASTGELVWRNSLDSTSSSPAVADSKVLVCSDACDIFALDRMTGGKLWSFETGTPRAMFTSPVVAYGNVYVGLGSTLYSFGNPLIGRLYLTSGNCVYSYDGEIWRIIKSCDDARSFSDMEVYDGKLYLSTIDQGWRKPLYQGGTGFSGRVIEFDGSIWTTILDHDYWIYSLGVYDGKLYAGTANNIFTYNGSTWETSFNATEGAYYALCFENYDGKIYVGMGNGYIFADPAPVKANPETIVVPEFSSNMILAVFMALTMLAAALTRKKRTKRFC